MKYLYIINAILVAFFFSLRGVETVLILKSPLGPRRDVHSLEEKSLEELFERTPILPDRIRLIDGAGGVYLEFDGGFDGTFDYIYRCAFVKDGYVAAAWCD